MSAPEPTFTERQAKAWTEAVADIRSRGVHVPESPYELFGSWRLTWREEVRPGRGCDLDAMWTDGEHLVQLTVTVYGEARASIAAIDWIHSDNFEECECERCTAERDAEDNDGWDDDEDDEEIDGRKVVDVVVVGGVL